MDRPLGCPGPDGAASSERALRLVASDGEIVGQGRKTAVSVKSERLALSPDEFVRRRRRAHPWRLSRSLRGEYPGVAPERRRGSGAPTAGRVAALARLPRIAQARRSGEPGTGERRDAREDHRQSARRGARLARASRRSGAGASRVFAGGARFLRAVGRGGTASFARPGSRARDDRRADDAAVRARVAQALFHAARGARDRGGWRRRDRRGSSPQRR